MGSFNNDDRIEGTRFGVRFAHAIAVLTFLTLLGSPVPRAAAAWVSPQQAAPLRDHYFDSHGVRIRYVDEGDGPAVVLIHGYIGNVERHWVDNGIFGNLVRDYRVIALDCRGHGKSDKPGDPTNFGSEMSRDIVRLLDHLQIQRAHVVGFSMGAFLVGHLLTTDADRFLSATFVGHHPLRRWTADDESEAEAFARDLESDMPFRSLILGIAPPGAPPSDEEIRTRSQALTAANNTKALAAYHRGLRNLLVADADLAAVRVPTLGIIGTADPAMFGLQELKTIMPTLSVVVVDGATHGGEQGVLRRPEFLVTLRGFLTGLR